MPRKRSYRTRHLSRREVRELDIKISFLEGILRRDSEFVEALQLIGDCYTARGCYRDSVRVDQTLARLEPHDPLVFYNLACSYSLNRQFTPAAVALEQALTLGYRDFKWLVKDPDLRGLRRHPAYQDVAERLRKMKVRPI